MGAKKAAKKRVTRQVTQDRQVETTQNTAGDTGLAPAPMGSKAKAMRDKLAAQPKVRVLIPLAPGEKEGVTQSVVLNGYPMYIRKGDYVEVPQAVADVLEAKMKHKMSIANHPDRIKSDGVVNLVSYGA